MSRIVRIFRSGDDFTPARVAASSDAVVAHARNSSWDAAPGLTIVSEWQDDGQGEYADFLVDSAELAAASPRVSSAALGTKRGTRELTDAASIAIRRRIR